MAWTCIDRNRSFLLEQIPLARGAVAVYVVGVNAGSGASHDPSACVVDADGNVVAFIEEERLSRVRHAYAQQPVLAVQGCLELAGLAAEDVDVIAVGWDEPRLSAQQGRPWGVWSPGVLVDQLGLKSSRSAPDVVFVPHHRAHAISAFCASPYEEAAIL